jgi:hypothetical protein
LLKKLKWLFALCDLRFLMVIFHLLWNIICENSLRSGLKVGCSREDLCLLLSDIKDYVKSIPAWHFSYHQRKIHSAASWWLNTCNPSYSGGRDQEDCGLKPAWVNSSRETLSRKIPITKRAGRVAQDTYSIENPCETSLEFLILRGWFSCNPLFSLSTKKQDFPCNLG